MGKWLRRLCPCCFASQKEKSQNPKKVNESPQMERTQSEEQETKFNFSKLSEFAEIVMDTCNNRRLIDEQFECYETGAVNHPDLLSVSSGHGLMATVIYAYNNHIPLILSPDDLWLLIALAVQEYLRRELVSFHKETLTVEGAKFGIRPKDTEANGWDQAMEEMCKLVEDSKGRAKDIIDIITEPFTTTGKIERIALCATLLGNLEQGHGDYFVVQSDGIPYVNLQGTADDYKSIIQRFERLIGTLTDFEIREGFESYLAPVRANLRKIYETKLGIVDTGWWGRMVTENTEKPGVSVPLSGWLADFLAFYIDPTAEPFPETVLGTNLDHITSFCELPLTRTRFELIDNLHTNLQYDMSLMCGFVGVALDKSKKAVRPAIGWMTFYNRKTPTDLKNNGDLGSGSVMSVSC